ncbi:MAG TPA: nitronate monooxygenase [Acidobacteriota bacterium]|nr:nitronate monooxygenase [Acidobacteriota bacterium]
MFGIRHPILQGGMLWLAGADLAAAVSNAGALGVLSPYAGMCEGGDPVDNLHRQINRTRDLTDKPFAVNIPLDLPSAGLLIDLLLRQEIAIAVTAAGSPELYTGLLRSAGIHVIHVISSARQARLAEECGVSAVIAEGIEAGGRLGRDSLPLFSLLHQVTAAVTAPVIAAGGITDKSGLTAAHKAGADGCQLGTRFVASKECPAHPDYKQAIIDAGDDATVVVSRNGISERILRQCIAATGRQPAAGRSLSRLAQLGGDLENGIAYAGASCGRINEILPAAAIVENLIE